MKTLRRILLSAAIVLAAAPLPAQVPQLINYQGRISVGGTNFDGTGQFKFALVNTAGTANFWANDGTASGAPATAISLTVTKGLYAVLLGDTTVTGMTTPIASSVFANSDVRLRVFFNDGTSGFQQLTPDQRIAAVGYALVASTVTDGAITTAKLAAGAVGSSALASGAVGSTHLAASSVGSTALAANSVNSTHIAANAVGSTAIAASAVTTTAINANAVTTAKLANNAVGAMQLANSAVGSSQLDLTGLTTVLWKAAGNSGTTAGTHYLGTSDNVALQLHVNGARAMRIEPNTNGAPNVIHGSVLNSVASGVAGAAIGGGGATNYGGSAFTNSVNASFGTVAGGARNVIDSTGLYASIGGGYDNEVSGNSATIAGGYFNLASGLESFIGSGQANLASGSVSFVGGGVTNLASGFESAIVGGEFNAATGTNAFIGAGFYNVASNFAVVGGGYANLASGKVTFVGGGTTNTASGFESAVVGGEYNFATGTNAFVGAGFYNVATNFSAVAGGYANFAGGKVSFVGGGTTNTASGFESAVVGGELNAATGTNSFIGGGYDNGATSVGAVVAGGSYNLASGAVSVIGGGYYNGASGYASTVPGGYANLASGSNSFAAGYVAAATNHGAFVWSDFSSTNTFGSTAANQFNVRASGGVRIFTDTAASRGVTLIANAVAWSSLSDHNVKKDFAPLDGRDVLRKLDDVPVLSWRYVWDDADSTPHVGPMAQDFKAAFYPGRDDKSISTLEFDGVELAAIKGLHELVKEKDAKITDLERRMAALEAKLEKLVK